MQHKSFICYKKVNKNFFESIQQNEKKSKNRNTTNEIICWALVPKKPSTSSGYHFLAWKNFIHTIAFLISYFLYIIINPYILLNLKYSNLCLLRLRRNHRKKGLQYIFWKQSFEFINIVRDLQGAKMNKSLPTLSAQFFTSVKTYCTYIY